MKKISTSQKTKKNNTVVCRTISIPLEIDAWLSNKKNREFATVSYFLTSLIRQAMEKSK